MDEAAKYRWIAQHVLPLEGEVRLWLRAHMRSLTAADIDDVIQEAYARLWPAESCCCLGSRSARFALERACSRYV